jgi:N6-L-threonylcarbamoyladenine synthase
MNILTIETTCDETAAAVITDRMEVLGSVVASQDELHRRFGGVVPEIASRAHVERILPVIDEALRKAGVSLSDLGAVAVANTPGLAGSLLVGLAAAKALCAALNVPLVAVNHLQGHIYACRLAAGEDVFPCVGLIISGGHTSLYRCRTPLEFDLLGSTTDDAAGEAFDKVASLLGLPYPGGPSVQKAAEGGNRRAYAFPRAFIRDDNRLDFSFSGLKTAVRYAIAKPGQQLPPSPFGRGAGGEGNVMNALLSPQQISDLAASFQEAVVDCLVVKSFQALKKTGMNILCVGGGVAANARLRERVQQEAAGQNVRLFIAPLPFCTDNAVMGAIALERLRAGLTEPLDLDVFPGVIRRHASH